MTRAVARAPRGERIVDHVSGGRWKNFTIIAGLRLDGISAPMLLPGAMNTESLQAWAVDCLCPTLRPNDIVIWDNLNIHADPLIACAIAERGAWLQFLPPHSPNLHPIEKAWMKMKSILRRLGPRSWTRLVAAVRRALLAVEPTDASCYVSRPMARRSRTRCVLDGTGSMT